MPLPVINGALRIAASGNCSNGPRWVNTWHVKNRSGVNFTQSAIQAMHEIFRQLYIGPDLGAGSAIRAFMVNTSDIDDFAYTPLDGTSGAFHFTEQSSGAGVSSAMPSEVSMVVTVRTADRGRRNRGRVYLPPFGTGAFESNGLFNSGAAAAIIAQINAIQDAVDTGGADLGVLSAGPYKGVTPDSPEEAALQHFTPAIAFTMDLVPDVQRRRKA